MPALAQLDHAIHEPLEIPELSVGRDRPDDLVPTLVAAGPLNRDVDEFAVALNLHDGVVSESAIVPRRSQAQTRVNWPTPSSTEVFEATLGSTSLQMAPLLLALALRMTVGVPDPLQAR